MPPQHRPLITVILTFLLHLAPLTTQLGINCNGSTYCHWFTDGTKWEQIVSSLNVSAQSINDTTTYSNGDNIACVPGGASRRGGLFPDKGAICVWVWNTNNDTTGAQVKHLLPQVWAHGCNLCGSTPIVEDGSNDVSKGMVTVGWSFNEDYCDGRCNEYGSSTYLPGDLVPSAGDGTPNGKRGLRFEG